MGIAAHAPAQTYVGAMRGNIVSRLAATVIRSTFGNANAEPVDELPLREIMLAGCAFTAELPHFCPAQHRIVNGLCGRVERLIIRSYFWERDTPWRPKLA